MKILQDLLEDRCFDDLAKFSSLSWYEVWPVDIALLLVTKTRSRSCPTSSIAGVAGISYALFRLS